MHFERKKKKKFFPFKYFLAIQCRDLGFDLIWPNNWLKFIWNNIFPISLPTNGMGEDDRERERERRGE